MGGTYVAEVISLLLMAIALGMDAFSISLGIGMQQLRLKKIAWIGILIGFFHIIMPFIGIILGKFISNEIGSFAMIAGGVLLAGIGIQMIFSAFIKESKQILDIAGFGLLAVAFTVSLDSFSVGLGLGMSGAKVVIVIVTFGVVSMLLTWLGLLLGRRVHGILGMYSEIIGGSILCGFGLNLLLG